MTQRQDKSKIISTSVLATCILAAFVFNPAFAQPAPATMPATQPGARAGRGARGPISSSPRDRLPFSNSNIANIKPDLPTFFICGDSTAATGDPDHRGWGAVLVDYFDTSKINLVNYSQGGINFPSYYTSRWPAVVAALKPGDFVVVELGHNGGHLPGIGQETAEAPARGRGAPPSTQAGQAATSTRPAQPPVHTYGWYIRMLIRDARAKGATTIVSTTSVRNIWTNPNAEFNEAKILSQKDNYNPADDRVERGMGDVMPDGRRTMLVWAEQVAREEGAPFVNHSEIAADLYEKMGRVAVQKFHPVDRTHFSTEGAIAQAETFISGLKALPETALVNALNEKGKAIAPYKPAAK